MALSRTAIQKKSNEKRGVKSKAFSLDADTIALFEKLSAQTGLPQVQVLKAALACFDEQLKNESNTHQ